MYVCLGDVGEDGEVLRPGLSQGPREMCKPRAKKLSRYIAFVNVMNIKNIKKPLTKKGWELQQWHVEITLHVPLK